MNVWKGYLVEESFTRVDSDIQAGLLGPFKERLEGKGGVLDLIIGEIDS